MAAKFEIRQLAAGGYTWVVTSQGRTLATGDKYARRASAEKAIEAARKAVATATVQDLTTKAPAKTVAKEVAKATRATKRPRKATAKRAG